MLNNQPNINLNDAEISDFSDKFPSPNIALNRESENEAKLAVLRAEIQLGIDALERGEYTKIDMDHLDAYFEKL